MTGALGFLGAPRQRSASNLSLARPPGPPLWIRDQNHSTRLVQLPGQPPGPASPHSVRLRLRTRSVRGRQGGIAAHVYSVLRRRLCAMVCPPSDRLEDRHRVAHNEKAAKVNLAGLLVLVLVLVLAGRRRRTQTQTQTQMQTRGAVWQLRPDAPIAPARWSLGPAAPTPLCNASALRCRPGVDSPDLVLVQLLVLTLHKVQSTRLSILPHSTNNNPHPLPPGPGPGPGPS